MRGGEKKATNTRSSILLEAYKIFCLKNLSGQLFDQISDFKLCIGFGMGLLLKFDGSFFDICQVFCLEMLCLILKKEIRACSPESELKVLQSFLYACPEALRFSGMRAINWARLVFFFFDF